MARYLVKIAVWAEVEADSDQDAWEVGNEISKEIAEEAPIGVSTHLINESMVEEVTSEKRWAVK